MSIELSFIYKKPHSKIISFTEIIKSCKPALSLFYRGFRVPSPSIQVVRAFGYITLTNLYKIKIIIWINTEGLLVKVT